MYKYFEDYSNRLCTYNFENWPFRGSKLKPSKLAMIGYECQEDGLFCNTCKSKFIISDPSIPNDVLLKQAYNTHEQNCPELAQIFAISQDFLHVYGQIYYNQCLETQTESIKLNQSYLDKIPNHFHYLLKDQKKVLAIFGWFRKDQFLMCKFCGRKCEIQNDEEFDVFEEHRYFCKWANEGKNFKYGYQTLLLKLKDESLEVKKVSEINTVREQVINTLENIIKASQTMKSEEIQIKESLSKVKEILEKRKRFSIQEFEKEWEEIEEGKKKKIKLQAELLNQQNQQNQEEQVQNEAVEIENQNEKQMEETIAKKQQEKKIIYNIVKNEINIENQKDQIDQILQENIQQSSQIEQKQNQDLNLQNQNQDQNLQIEKIEIEAENKNFPEDEQQKLSQIQQFTEQQIENNIETNNEIKNEKKLSEEQDQQINVEQLQQQQQIQPEDKAQDKIDEVKISEIDQNFNQEKVEQQKEALQVNEQENSNENKKENCSEIQIEQQNQVEDCNKQMIALQIEPNSEINENKIEEQDQDQEKEFPEIKDLDELQDQNDFQGLVEQQILNPFEEEQNIHTKVNLEDQIQNNQQLEATKDQAEIENENIVVQQNDLALNTLQQNIDQQVENQSDFLPEQRVTTDQQDQEQIIQEETQIQQS